MLRLVGALLQLAGAGIKPDLISKGAPSSNVPLNHRSPYRPSISNSQAYVRFRYGHLDSPKIRFELIELIYFMSYRMQ